jgi:hypothetical protein
MTYAVPGSQGPAQVPITPFTASAPFSWGDSNQSSSRSAMLIVISRVTSATVRASTPRLRHTSFASAATSDGACEPIVGGTVISRGAITSATPSSQAFQPSQARASLLDHFAICSRVRAGSSSWIVSDPPSGNAW